MVVALRVEIALHDLLLVVPIVCACPTAWGVGNLHQTAAVEEEPCPSAVGSKSQDRQSWLERKVILRFWGFTAQRGWARLILDRFYDLVFLPDNPSTAAHEPDSVSHEHQTFFFPDCGHGTANTAGFGWRGGSGV